MQRPADDTDARWPHGPGPYSVTAYKTPAAPPATYTIPSATAGSLYKDLAVWKLHRCTLYATEDPDDDTGIWGGA